MLIALLLAVLALGATLVWWWWTCGGSECPAPAALHAWQPSEGGVLYGHDGSAVGALVPVRRTNVRLHTVPSVVAAAFVAVEDRRFFRHRGVDWYAVARAVWSNVRAAGVREGASTITMQLARTVFLPTQATERTWTRKLLEWRYAVLLEDALSKREILERYLNAIYLGHGVYGVDAASRDLFGRPVQALGIAEAAMLAALPKAPTTYSPRTSRERARDRRDIVLDVLVREGVVDHQAAASVRREPVHTPGVRWIPDRRVSSWAVEAVRTVLDSLREAHVIPPRLTDAHLCVWSTIDGKAQEAAQAAVHSGAERIDLERRAVGQVVRGRGATQGALVALDPFTGAIRAIVGGREVRRGGFHRAIRARRQPGSTFKPFVYVAALQAGYTLASLVDDLPVEVASGTTLWRPANFGDRYAGRITLRDALARSANAATVRLSREIGLHHVVRTARTHGITSPLPLVPALALGAAGVSPLELTAAYASFANGGRQVRPFLVERVVDPFGRVLWQRIPERGDIILDAVDAFLMTSLLRHAVDHGTGRPVRDAGIAGPVAGKTGTTTDGTDVWFVGYTPTMAATVWFGADLPTPLGNNASGGRLAGIPWAEFVRTGWHDPMLDPPWRPPAGIDSAWIDIATGKRASRWCGASRREYFRLGTIPVGSCEPAYDWSPYLAELFTIEDSAQTLPP